MGSVVKSQWISKCHKTMDVGKKKKKGLKGLVGNNWGQEVLYQQAKSLGDGVGVLEEVSIGRLQED